MHHAAFSPAAKHLPGFCNVWGNRLTVMKSGSDLSGKIPPSNEWRGFIMQIGGSH
jgi:hypothetical protein